MTFRPLTQTSPTSPAGSARSASSWIETLDPGNRAPHRAYLARAATDDAADTTGEASVRP